MLGLIGHIHCRNFFFFFQTQMQTDSKYSNFFFFVLIAFFSVFFFSEITDYTYYKFMPQTFFSKVSLISVSLDVTVEAVIGGSVVLPCSSAEHDLKLQEVDVSWRHNGSKNVCDLIPHSNLLETQDPRYKNRTKTFPEEYERRNFSIKLSGLIHADAGKYICLITPSDEQETVELIINGV